MAGAIERVDDKWVAESPMGKVDVRFVDPNELGVLDHDVTMETGDTVHNPVRVLPRPDGGSEVVFTLFRRPEMSDEELERDAATVMKDLRALKTLLE